MEIYDPAAPVDPEQLRSAELDAYKADMKRRGFCLESLKVSPESLGFDGYLELAYEMGATALRRPATYDAAPRRTLDEVGTAAAPSEALQRTYAQAINPYS